jgi:hypothetical protein
MGLPRSVRPRSWRPRRRRSGGQRRRRGRRRTRKSEGSPGGPWRRRHEHYLQLYLPVLLMSKTTSIPAFTAGMSCSWLQCLLSLSLLTCAQCPMHMVSHACVLPLAHPAPREKEAAKAAERTEKAAARTTKSAAVSAPAGPPDDEDLEMDKLLAVGQTQQCSDPADTGRTSRHRLQNAGWLAYLEDQQASNV